MIRILRAFAVFRWRLFINSLRGRRRDSLEQISRISRLLVIAIVSSTLVPASILFAFLAIVGGRGLAQGTASALPLLMGARGALFMVMLFVAISPILRFGGIPSSVTRLALLPISRRGLFGMEIVSQLADPWILALTPALLAFPAGLAAGGDARAACWALLAALGILGALATLGSAASLLGALLFRNRRLGEYTMIVVLVAIMAGAYVPMLFGRNAASRGRSSTERAAGAPRPGITIPLSSLSSSRWARLLPSEAYVRALEDALRSRTESPALPLASLAGLAVVLGGAARWAFGRLFDAPGERRNRATRATAAIRAIPGVTPAASAVAWTTMRLMLRSVRGRVMIFTAPIPVLMIGLYWRTTPLAGSHASIAGVIGAALGTTMSLLALQSVLADQFAIDRAGLTLTFLTPVADRDLVAGKAVGCGLAAAIPVSLSILFSAALHPGGSLLLWAAVPVAATAAFVAQSPVAAFLSAAFPASYDLMTLKGGNAHPLAAILCSLSTALSLGVFGGLGALVYVLMDSPVLALCAAGGGLALACGIAWLGYPTVARVIGRRRENLAMIAQGR